MRFFGEIGFGVSKETRPGIWEDVITERNYYGDVEHNAMHMSNRNGVLTENTLQTSISVVADAYALENFTAIKYVGWAGSLWVVTSVAYTQRPRLVLYIGEVYDGPTPAPIVP